MLKRNFILVLFINFSRFDDDMRLNRYILYVEADRLVHAHNSFIYKCGVLCARTLTITLTKRMAYYSSHRAVVSLCERKRWDKYTP